MQVGFQHSQHGFEQQDVSQHVERLQENGLPKVYGKYFRDPHDPLVVRQTANDPRKPWHKEISFLWDIEGKRFKFQDKESTQKAIDSGKYFNSTVEAAAAKSAQLEAERAALKEELAMRKELEALRAKDKENLLKAKKEKAVDTGE